MSLGIHKSLLKRSYSLIDRTWSSLGSSRRHFETQHYGNPLISRITTCRTVVKSVTKKQRPLIWKVEVKERNPRWQIRRYHTPKQGKAGHRLSLQSRRSHKMFQIEIKVHFFWYIPYQKQIHFCDATMSLTRFNFDHLYIFVLLGSDAIFFRRLPGQNW